VPDWAPSVVCWCHLPSRYEPDSLAKSRQLSKFSILIIAMRFSTFSPVIFLIGLSLAYNEMSTGMRFWNTTMAQPTETPLNVIPLTSSSSIEEVATIQIQVGSLSGSGVISLRNVATTREVGQLNGSLPTSFANQSYSQPTSCQRNSTAAFPPGSTSAQNLDATMGASTGQPSAGLTSLTSQIFTGSGSRNPLPFYWV